jgi:hypothetical protein
VPPSWENLRVEVRTIPSPEGAFCVHPRPRTGPVLVDTAVMMAEGGNTIRGIDVLRQPTRPARRGRSPPTVSRALTEIDDAGLHRLDATRAEVRALVWNLSWPATAASPQPSRSAIQYVLGDAHAQLACLARLQQTALGPVAQGCEQQFGAVDRLVNRPVRGRVRTTGHDVEQVGDVERVQPAQGLAQRGCPGSMTVACPGRWSSAARQPENDRPRGGRGGTVHLTAARRSRRRVWRCSRLIAMPTC